MKYSVIFLLIFLFNCTPDEVEPSGYMGRATLNLNNSPIKFKPFGICKGQTIDVHMHGFSEMGFSRYQLTFEMLKKREYAIDSFASFDSGSEFESAYMLTALDDGHVLGNMYRNLNLPGDYVEITELDTITGELSGKFQLTLVVDSNFVQNDPWGVDTIFMKDGVFNTRLK
jgi:hypothetical protein